MKTTILTIALALLLGACQKDNGPQVAVQQSSSLTPTYNKAKLSSMDSLIIGEWQIDSIYNKFPGSTVFTGAKMDSTIEFIYDFTDTLVTANLKVYKRKTPGKAWDYTSTWEIVNGRIKNVESPKDSIIYIGPKRFVLEGQVKDPSIEIITKTVFIKR